MTPNKDNPEEDEIILSNKALASIQRVQALGLSAPFEVAQQLESDQVPQFIAEAMAANVYQPLYNAIQKLTDLQPIITQPKRRTTK